MLLHFLFINVFSQQCGHGVFVSSNASHNLLPIKRIDLRFNVSEINLKKFEFFVIATSLGLVNKLC